MPAASTAEIIDLISSEDIPDIPTSSPVQFVESRTNASNPAVAAPTAQAFDFSDDIDFLPPVPKRRRITPPPPSPPNNVVARVSAVASNAGAKVGSKEKGTQANSGLTVSQKLHIDFDDDDILAASSPALPIRASPRHAAASLIPDRPQKSQQQGCMQRVEDLLGEFMSSEDSPVANSVSRDMQFSQKTAALLAEIDTNRIAGRRLGTGTSDAAPAAVRGPGTTLKFKHPGLRSDPKAAAPKSSIEDPSSPVRQSASMVPRPAAAAASKRQKLSTREREQKAREKAEEKELAKAQKAAERIAAKEAKAQEKQLAADLAEVNRARHDKKVSTGEMIVCVSETVRELGTLAVLVEDVLKQLEVQMEPLPVSEDVDFGGRKIASGIVNWKRRVRARYDEEVGHWVPLGRIEIREESSHVLCVVLAERLVEMIQVEAKDGSDGGTSVQDEQASVSSNQISLTAHCAAVKQKWPSRKPIYLIEGLEPFLRKSRNSRNRNYQAAVRAQQEAEAPSINAESTAQPAQPAQRQRKRKTAPPKQQQQQPLTIDDDTIEDALLELQVEHNCLIHHTSCAAETAEWIGNFTQHISTIPYKARQHGGGGGDGAGSGTGEHDTAAPSFCMDVGQVRTGEDKADTYAKMLGEIVRVTLPVAYGIAARYPSVRLLLAGMKEKGPLFCEDLKKCSNKNGAFTDARIGPALSRRIYKVFMGMNPDTLDV